MNFTFVIIIIVFTLNATISFAQCCGGGSGSPIAGGASQGVLLEKQMEINSNFQYTNTHKFYTGDSPDTNFLDNYNSKYIYTKIAYGITKKFTLSLETGYWLNKTQVGLHRIDTNSSKGFGDLIIFPRYNVINISKNSRRTELTIGLGFKIPLGSYNDSSKYVLILQPVLPNEIYYTQKPLAVQASSGAQDILFYLFLLRSNNIKKINFFTNAMYIRKGWNPMGEKVGDFASVGLFVSKSFFKHFGVTFQLRGEWVDQMKLNKNILLYAYPNYNPLATGYRKLFFTPQVSYNYKDRFIFYILSDIPLYQHLFNTQIGSQYQMTFGISYRFYPVDPTKKTDSEAK